MKIIASPRESASASPGLRSGAPPTRSHFAFLDGLRGWASLAVVFFHLPFYRSELTEIGAALPAVLVDEIFARGNLGVAVFFVLSGFVIAYSSRGGLAVSVVLDLRADAAAGPNDEPPQPSPMVASPVVAPVPMGTVKPFSAVVFAVRRVLRIAPPYYVAIMAALVFAFGAARQSGGPFEPGEAPFTWARFGAHLFFGQEILGFVNFNDVFWTLGLELQFYAVFAGLIVVQRWLGPQLWRVSTTTLVFGLAGLSSVAWTLTMAPGAPRAVWFPPLVYSFLLGVLVLLRALRLVSWVLPAVMLAATVAVASVHAYNREFTLASAATAAVLWLVVEVGRLDRILADPVSQLLGRVSYSLYLIHTPVLGAALVVSSLVLPQTAVGQAIGLCLALAGSMVAAVMMYYLIERPSVRWSRRFGA